MQSRKEKAEKAQMKAAIAKAGTQNEKGKTHPETSAIQTETVDTEISTGSKEKEQQEEKSPEMLAREAAVVLAALSTPIKKREKKEANLHVLQSQKKHKDQSRKTLATVQGIDYH